MSTELGQIQIHKDAVAELDAGLAALEWFRAQVEGVVRRVLAFGRKFVGAAQVAAARVERDVRAECEPRKQSNDRDIEL